MASKRRYSFEEQLDAVGGKRAAILAVISLIAFVALILVSFFQGGRANEAAGAIALAACLLSVYGFYLGMRSFAEKKTRPFWSIAGSIASGAMMICWLTLFLTGLG